MATLKCGTTAPAAVLSSRTAVGSHVAQLGAVRLPARSCCTRSGVISASHEPQEGSSVRNSKVLVALVAAGASLTLATAAPVWSAHAAIVREGVERTDTTDVGDASSLRGSANGGNQEEDDSTGRQGEGRQGESLNLKELANSEEVQTVKNAAGDVAKGAAQSVATKAATDFASTQLGIPGAAAAAATQVVSKVVTN